MKKILILSISLLAFNSFADDSEVKKEIDNNVTVIATGEGIGLGGSVNWKKKTTDEESETTSTSSIKLIPVGITSSGVDKGAAPKIHLDLFGDKEKKHFLSYGNSSLKPYLLVTQSPLEYTYDGEQASVRMLNGGAGAGLKFNLTDDIKLGAHVGLGLGVELGKRSGIFDGSYFSQVDLSLYDVVDFVAKQEVRKSLDGDREAISEVNLGVRVNDNIRAGLEFESSDNTFVNEENYKASYGGIYLSGRFGNSK